MRQVTGSNHTPSNKKVSIQLRLDGLLFIGDNLPQHNAEDGSIVEVELLTAKSVVVPTECFEPALAERYLQMSGIRCAAEEQPVWSDDCEGVTAIMVLRREIAEQLTARYGESLRYTTPLLHNVQCAGAHLYIYNAGNVVYFKLYNGEKVEFCEAISMPSADDVLYFVERLVSEFPSEDFSIHVAGTDTNSLRNLLKQYYKVVKCE